MALGFRIANPFDIFDDEERKLRRGSTAAYRPSRKYDVPIPPKLKPKVKAEIEKRRQARLEHARQSPASVLGVGLPRIPGLRPAVGDIRDLAAGLIPAAKTVGKAAAKDVKASWHGDLARVNKKTLEDYHALLKWTVADEKGDKRKRPKTDSEMIGLLAEMTRGWGRGIERALPDPFDSEDIKEFKKAWSEDPVFTALDVVPFASMITRPLSVAKHAAAIERANEISRGRALAMGVKESYRPGAARRAGLKGGISPRMLKSDMGEVQGRPWSRTPLMRVFQRKYDALFEPEGRAAGTPVGRVREKAGRHRVGSAERRAEGEMQRRIRLETDELTDPVSKLIYGRLGRAAGAFGLKKNMTAKERRTATALIYRMQMPLHHAHTDALKAVQDDLSEILQSGQIELPKGGRTKTVPLSEAERDNLAIQISDLDLARQDLAKGARDGIGLEEFDSALDALSEIAGRTNDVGLDILERRLKLDPDAIGEIADGWRRRAEVLPRRLANRGHIPWKAVEDSEERSKWLEVLQGQLGEDQGRTLVAITDALARRIRPQDPSSFWTERVGMPTGESARQLVDRIGDDALFQNAPAHAVPGYREDFISTLVEGMESGTLTNRNIFYSPLQRWLDEKWPPEAKAMKKQTLQKQVLNVIPEAEYYNAGLDLFFDGFRAEERITKEAFQEHLSSWLNAYNIQEHHFINRRHHATGDPYTQDGPSDTTYDMYEGGSVLSRTPEVGEYHEIVMRLKGKGRDTGSEGYMGEAYDHWDLENVVVHMRFHVVEEDGVRKLIVDEIQSDWASEHKQHPLGPVTEEAAANLEQAKELAEKHLKDWRRLERDYQDVSLQMRDLEDQLMELETQFQAPGMTEASRERIAAEIEPLNRERVELGGRENDLYHQKENAKDEAVHYEGMADWLTSDRGVAPDPLGGSYHRAAIRRLSRQAVDEGVEEIVFVDPLVQLTRTRGHHELLDPAGGGADTAEMMAWWREKEPLWQRELQAADERVDAQLAERGVKREEMNKNDLEQFYSYQERDMRNELQSLKTWRHLYGESFPNFLRKEYKLDGVQAKADAYRGRWSGENGVFGRDTQMPGMVLKVNDEMRRKVASAQSLYQRAVDPNELPRGATELLQGRTLAHLFEQGGPDTWMHELGHIALHDLHGDDLDTLAQHYAQGKPLAEWARADHENYARDWENYWRRGISPTPELASVFKKISAWMKEIWQQAKQRGSATAVPENVREVFDGLFKRVPDEGDELATYGYFPHRDLHEIASAEYRGGVRPAAAGQTIGVPRLSREAIERGKNELVLYQGGRLNPDPAGLVDVYLKRLRFQETLDARDALWGVGHPMTERPPKGAWLVRNPDETPERITPEVQGAVRGQELRRDVENNLDEHLSVTPDDFRKEIVARASENPKWGGDMENVRWVPGEYVNARFGQVFDSSPRGKLASTGGLLTSMQRATGIYGRPLSYIGGNVPFNVTALLATMPAANIRSAERMFRMRKSNPELYRAISSEAGQTRAESGLPGVAYTRAVNPVQGAERQATQVQRGMADVLSAVADDPFRVTAFLSNARKRGYHTDAELEELIAHNGADLTDIRQLTREQLLDFDALNPLQRKLASNLLYLWPFMYAATKWPLMYAREYPARAGAQAQLIEQEPERLDPIEVANFWKSKGIDFSAVNPLGPIGGMAEDLDQLLRDPTKMDLTVLKERLSPTLDLLVEGMGGGKKNAIQNFVRGTVPGAAEAGAFIGEEWRGSKMYADRDRPGPYLATRHLRFFPRDLNEQRMKEVIAQHKLDEITTATLDRKKADDKTKINRYLKALGGVDYQEDLQKSVDAWWDYQEAVDQKKDSTGQRKLSPVQQVEVLDDVVREHFPELAGELYPLDDVRAAKDMGTVEEYVKELRNVINEGRSMLFDDYRSYAAE